ncbi:alanyl-tRNA synthetase [Marihabitans asiaticum]|uniref:Ser-tRNA(Ala) deacylase AlaX n=2 Tax=Marihabitans asiaticum TaxID=415218 RepID=A0A560WEH8_9MICO|nr:Ser-tRNA(Ala) deacylase AlaX [Marihabitans asiaticum]
MAIMEQRRRYWEDTYLTEVDTEVVAAREDPGPALAVRDGIVHPKGGGQPDDVVRVDGRLATVSKDEAGIVWLAPEDDEARAEVGGSVHVAIDLQVRRQHAALHSAGHLLDACVLPLGFTNIGLSHTPGQAFLLYDVDGGTLPTDEESKAALVEEVLDRARRLVAADLPYSAEVDGEGVRRVTIEGVQTDPCGGTHVRSTADLAGLAITRVRTKKGQLKLSYTAEHA